MNRLSYEDLAWEPVCLQPSRYSLTDGVLTPWGVNMQAVKPSMLTSLSTK